MHIAEGILPLSHAAARTIVAAPIVVASGRDVVRALCDGEAGERALLGMAGALTFAVTPARGWRSPVPAARARRRSSSSSRGCCRWPPAPS
jgi:hypothetical protein